MRKGLILDELGDLKPIQIPNMGTIPTSSMGAMVEYARCSVPGCTADTAHVRCKHLSPGKRYEKLSAEQKRNGQEFILSMVQGSYQTHEIVLHGPVVSASTVTRQPPSEDDVDTLLVHVDSIQVDDHQTRKTQSAFELNYGYNKLDKHDPVNLYGCLSVWFARSAALHFPWREMKSYVERQNVAHVLKTWGRISVERLEPGEEARERALIYVPIPALLAQWSRRLGHGT